MTITATEPAGLPPFKGLITFTRDGEVLESRRPYVPFTPFGPLIESSGHGAWTRTGRRQFSVVFQFLLQAAPNNPDLHQRRGPGTDNIRLQLERARSGESFTGTFASAARDAQGNVVFEARGTVTGSRLRPSFREERGLRAAAQRARRPARHRRLLGDRDRRNQIRQRRARGEHILQFEGESLSRTRPTS